MLLRYGIFSLLVVAVFVMAKLWLFPYLLYRVFPGSDTGAVLYEMLVLALGACTLVLYMFLGHYGKYRAGLSRGRQMAVILILQAPFFLHGWLKMQEIVPREYTFLYSFAEGGAPCSLNRSACFFLYTRGLMSLLCWPVWLLFCSADSSGTRSLNFFTL